MVNSQIIDTIYVPYSPVLHHDVSLYSKQWYDKNLQVNIADGYSYVQ